jgi:hypothetical protein
MPLRTKVRSADGRRTLGAVLAVVLVAATVVVLGPTPRAYASCGDGEVTRTYLGPDVGGWYMGAFAYKLNVGCFDGNVRYSSQSASHRGQWFSDAQQWLWSSVGPKSISAGTQSPVVVLIEGPISVGRKLRIGSTWHESWGKWWF